MKNIIICKKWNWLWVGILFLVLLAGIGFFVQIPQGKDDFEKVFFGIFGTMMMLIGGTGIIILLFGEKKANEIGNWIYGFMMFLAAIGFFCTLIVGGILALFGVKI